MPTRHVEMIDCTLRDGEQAPGVAFTLAEKVTIGTALSEAGVDVLDAGFPASGGEEVETLQELRRAGLSARIGATARPFVGDIAAAEKAHAEEVFLFMPTSDARIEQTLGTSRAGAVERYRDGAREVVGRGMALNVVFEDATRADPDFLAEFVERIGECVPVTRVIVADSVGCARPDGMAALVRRLRGSVDPTVRLCPHCHNDFGLAAANTLAAVDAGCDSVTVTVNGLGERAGNADLAEVATGLRYLYGIEHRIVLTALTGLAELVERLSGVHTAITKPVTGLNVFRHESGVHVDAMLKSARSYEYLPSRDLGRRTEFVLGKHSGSALVRFLLDEPGVEPMTEEAVHSVLGLVKRRAAGTAREAYHRLHEQRRRFFDEHLSGVDRAELTAMLAELAPVSPSSPPPAGASAAVERAEQG